MTMKKPPPCTWTRNLSKFRFFKTALLNVIFSFKPILRLEKGLNTILERSEGGETTDKNDVRVNANSLLPCPACRGHLR